MLAISLALQLCAVVSPATVVTAGHGASHPTLAPSATHLAVGWMERRAGRPDGNPPTSPRYAMVRVLDRGTLAPVGAGTVTDHQEEGYQQVYDQGVVARGGALAAVGCDCLGGSGSMGCWIQSVDPTTGASGAHTRMGATRSEGSCGEGFTAVSAAGNDVLAVVQSFASAPYVYGTAFPGREFAWDAPTGGDGELPAGTRGPRWALTPAGPGRFMTTWTTAQGLFQRLLGANGRGTTRAVAVSARGSQVGAPAVAWQGSSGTTVFAARDTPTAPWALHVARWTPPAPVAHQVLATGTEPAMAPSVVAGVEPGCMVISWTEGHGHGTVARAARVCDGVLVPGTVAQVSQPGIEAGDTVLAADGGVVWVAWQEIPAGQGGHAELRVARLGCH